MKGHQAVFNHIDQYGESSARRLFSNRLVDEVLRLAGTRHLVLGHITWGAGVNGEVSGVDLARVALRAAMKQARKNGNGPKAKKKPRTGATVSAPPAQGHSAYHTRVTSDANSSPPAQGPVGVPSV
ncbi:hypothetical protein ABT354_30805 [Streptomyces sp. NPDC000594]|uniref:hypothetical protein n=1 Tax=Streptomyces sp. NPDC000594 TaxID=3154261 RepID=UPI0033264532